MLPESNDFLNGVISFAICGLQFDREYLVWLSVKQAAGQPLVGKPVKITSAKILWLPVGSRPNTQDRAGNQVAYIPIMSAKVSSRISKERAHRKKPDIQRQQGNRKTLKVTAAEEYTIF